LTIVVPVLNESENLRPLIEEIDAALVETSLDYEILVVDDGSDDDSFELIHELHQKYPQLGMIRFRRNFGQTAAFAAGFDKARGKVIVTIDADRQNDPADIPPLVEKLSEGYDLVSGWRFHRKDKFLTRTLPSRLANGLISAVTGVKLHDYGCTLKAYKREVLTGFRLYGEMHRFIPVYANSVGAKITEIKVHHHERKYGKAKYGLERTFKVVLDLFTVKFLTSYSSKPIYLFGGAGAGLIAVSFLTLLYLGIRRIVEKISPFSSPLFIIAVMVAIMGFQSILMGLIAELLARTYHESQNKPVYTIREIIK